MAAQFSQTVRALANDSPRAAHALWVAAGLCLCCWSFWFVASSVTVYEVSQRARLEVRKASHQVDALIAGQMVSTSLAIGRDVSAGDVLVELDSTRDRLRLKEEQSRLASVVLRIESLRREIEFRVKAKEEDLEGARAAADVARARISEARIAMEFSRGAEERAAQLIATGSGARVEALRTSAETHKQLASQAGWEAEVQRIDREARSRMFQNDAQIEALRNTLAMLDGDVATTQSTIARLSAELGKYQVRAPIGGRLADVAPFRVGAYVTEGQHLATILPTDELVIIADFAPSAAFGRLAQGQSARLRLDGFPWAQYGTISASVMSVAGEIRDGLVRVEFNVESWPASGVFLQHGLPGAVEVTIEETSPARLVLRSAGLILSGGTRAGAAP